MTTQANWRLLDAAAKGNLEDARAALADRADPDVRDFHGTPAVVEAAGRGYGEIVELLRHHGADIEARDRLGNRPRDVAIDPAADVIHRMLRETAAAG